MQHNIIEEARALLGVKFHHQGRSAETGVDCLGLLVLVARACGLICEGVPVDSHDRVDYGHNPDTVFLRASLERFLVPVDRAAMQVGDVGLFEIDKRPQHMAIISDYAAQGAFGMIHAYAPLRKVVEHRLDTSWMVRLVAVYRFAGA